MAASGVDKGDIDAVADEVVHAGRRSLPKRLHVPYHHRGHERYGARQTSDPCRGRSMAGAVIPHFANDVGAEQIFVGVKEFNCMGARPPFDHPHVYLDMGRTSKSSAPTARRFTSTIRGSKPPKAIRRTAS